MPVMNREADGFRGGASNVTYMEEQAAQRTNKPAQTRRYAGDNVLEKHRPLISNRSSEAARSAPKA